MSASMEMIGRVASKVFDHIHAKETKENKIKSQIFFHVCSSNGIDVFGFQIGYYEGYDLPYLAIRFALEL